LLINYYFLFDCYSNKPTKELFVQPSTGNIRVEVTEQTEQNSPIIITSKPESVIRPTTAIINEVKDNSSPEVVAEPDQAGQGECPRVNLVTYKKPLTTRDANYKTPLYDPNSNKYVTFEPDVGGWNNIRMQMETVLVFAAATGRTLVLPPDQPMYLLNKGKGHENEHHFADFFPFDEIVKDNRVNVISMEDYLTKEALQGTLRVSLRSLDTVYHPDNTNSVYHVNETSPHPPGSVVYPPNMQSSFSGTDREQRRTMWSYLRLVSACPKWEPFEDFVIIPSTLTPQKEGDTKKYYYFANHTGPIAQARLSNFASKRKGNVYDASWQDEKVIHFLSVPGMGYRLLTHFYTFIYFEDFFMDLYYKRFVRYKFIY
jgi:hypothetical protein